MIIQIIADIHGNLRALDTALADGRARGAQQLVVMGDIVDAFSKWNQNSECIRRLRSAPLWLAVRGNHDQWLAAESRVRDGIGRRSLALTLASYLMGLPLIVRAFDATFVHATVPDPIGVDGIVHPRVKNPPCGTCTTKAALYEAGTRIVFCAHTHAAFIEVFAEPGKKSEVFAPGDGPVHLSGRRAVINPGSISRPNEEWMDPPVASYALWDPEADVVELVGEPQYV